MTEFERLCAANATPEPSGAIDIVADRSSPIVALCGGGSGGACVVVAACTWLDLRRDSHTDSIMVGRATSCATDSTERSAAAPAALTSDLAASAVWFASSASSSSSSSAADSVADEDDEEDEEDDDGSPGAPEMVRFRRAFWCRPLDWACADSAAARSEPRSDDDESRASASSGVVRPSVVVCAWTKLVAAAFSCRLCWLAAAANLACLRCVLVASLPGGGAIGFAWTLVGAAVFVAVAAIVVVVVVGALVVVVVVVAVVALVAALADELAEAAPAVAAVVAASSALALLVSVEYR